MLLVAVYRHGQERKPRRKSPGNQYDRQSEQDGHESHPGTAPDKIDTLCNQRTTYRRHTNLVLWIRLFHSWALLGNGHATLGKQSRIDAYRHFSKLGRCSVMPSLKFAENQEVRAMVREDTDPSTNRISPSGYERAILHVRDVRYRDNFIMVSRRVF
jgi:hypothetical protein